VNVFCENRQDWQQQQQQLDTDLCQLVEGQVTSSAVSQPPGNNAQVLISMTTCQASAPDGR